MTALPQTPGRPASHGRRASAMPWLKWPVTAATALMLLWLVMQLHWLGRPMWALALLVLGTLVIAVYASRASLAWRYLLPGVLGMLVFVALPLVYTAQIGFTNYSSAHLLSEDRARAYLLDQALFDETKAMDFTLHAEGSGHRLRLAPPEGAAGPRYATPVLNLRDSPGGASITATLDDAGQQASTALPMRDVIALRDGLGPLVLQLLGGEMLHYAGLREFAPRQPLWRTDASGALTQAATSAATPQVYAPNRNTGYFEKANAERLQPGFTVGIGWANYQRLFGDADVRGPFVSIFIWTVTFAALTVLFSTAIGLTLAVVLNWEALSHRTLYRTLLFLPYAVPGFISILVFKGLFNQNFGEINAILDALFGARPAWFADPLLAKTMLLIVNTWLGYPYILVLCTGLIKAIPGDLYEASAIAGAGPLTNFFKITMPLVAKPLTPLLVSAFAFNFNNFVLIALLTDGRPDYLNTKVPAGTTDILVSYTYRIAFTDAGQNFGLAAAISTVIFLLVALMSLLNLRLSRAAAPKR